MHSRKNIYPFLTSSVSTSAVHPFLFVPTITLSAVVPVSFLIFSSCSDFDSILTKKYCQRPLTQKSMYHIGQRKSLANTCFCTHKFPLYLHLLTRFLICCGSFLARANLLCVCVTSYGGSDGSKGKGSNA